MKREHVLWIELILALVCIAVGHTAFTAHAQQLPVSTGVHLMTVTADRSFVNVSGKVVGFSCVHIDGSGTFCTIATTD